MAVVCSASIDKGAATTKGTLAYIRSISNRATYESVLRGAGDATKITTKS